MDWSDSVFREHPKYYGDIEFSKAPSIGDNGLVTSKKWIAFRYQSKIGILSTNFETNIDEKLASGRKAEYGSKVYTTTKVDQIAVDGDVLGLHFSPYHDHHLLCGTNSGTLSIFDLSDSNKELSKMQGLSKSINSVDYHPSSSEVLAVAGSEGIDILDMVNGGKSVLSAKLDDNVLNVAFAPDGSHLRAITEKKVLLMLDPRTKSGVEQSVTLRYAPSGIVSLRDDGMIAVCGSTPFQEPIVYAYDLNKGLDDKIHEGYVFKQSWHHKHCRPFMRYDRYTELLYLAFESCADVLALNTAAGFEKQSVYHSVDDTFMAFDFLPKNAGKKREINKLIKWSKTRIQQIVHTRGGKPIYEKLSDSARPSSSSMEDYMANKNTPTDDEKICKLVPPDFEEQKKRSVSLYIHISGNAPGSVNHKYFDLKLSSTINCNLGLNLRSNTKYALFPAQTFGGGALGIIQLKSIGRKKQSTLTAHSDKITTFDVCRIAGLEQYVITGSPDCKACVHRINEDSKGGISGVTKLFTHQCSGRVNFVGFHPRIKNLALIACNKEHASSSNVYVFDYAAGKCLANYVLEDTKNVMDVQCEPVMGLVAAVSAANGIIRVMDLRTGAVLKMFQADTMQRDTKLFWATDEGAQKPRYFGRLICLGFGKGSVRKFTTYDVSDTVETYYAQNVTGSADEAKDADDDQDDNVEEEEKKSDDAAVEEVHVIGSVSFGVSNAIPIGHYEPNHNLFFVSGVGGRRIRTYEFTERGIAEMNASYQSKEDIHGMDFGLKQMTNVKAVEIGKCLNMTKGGVIEPIPFSIPRKRKEFFQDDLFSDVLDTYNGALEMDIMKKGKLDVEVKYISMRPDDMELLSNAPEEKTDRQKRRASQTKLMEAQKLKEQPKSTEQAFDQFSRMVADAPTANRWDAQNIGTEVDDDEWSD